MGMEEYMKITEYITKNLWTIICICLSDYHANVISYYVQGLKIQSWHFTVGQICFGVNQYKKIKHTQTLNPIFN